MRSCLVRTILVAVVSLAFTAAVPAARAADYKIDPVHSSVSFQVQHAGISWIHGRFDTIEGGCTVDKDDPGKSSFELTCQVGSIDTNNKKRDEHLQSPDFFNAKQYPTVSFKSTAVKAAGSGYEVTGDLTMHGKTKSITFTLNGGKTAEFPKGVKRVGFATELKLKRSDFGMENMLNAIGDEVPVAIAFEAVQK